MPVRDKNRQSTSHNDDRLATLQMRVNEMQKKLEEEKNEKEVC